jgi:hypothetical protein
MSLARYLDEPPWHEALINLIDAMSAFIKVDVQYGESFLREGAISREDFDKGMVETRQMQALLRKLREFEVDPTLEGLLR